MPYSISYSRSAAKALKSIHPQDRRRILEAVESLAAEPRPPGSIQLSGGEGECRNRVGDYRIVYDIEHEEVLILVLRIGHRREVYRQ
ncbi:MAG: plasmid stabilization protein [Brachybacterium faecium]|nr:MAG: plasmid stabilization protein [Brachybacterium faecium]